MPGVGMPTGLWGGVRYSPGIEGNPRKRHLHGAAWRHEDALSKEGTTLRSVGLEDGGPEGLTVSCDGVEVQGSGDHAQGAGELDELRINLIARRVEIRHADG